MPRGKKRAQAAPEEAPPVERPPLTVEAVPSVTPWDFRRTTRFSAEAVRGIRRLFEHWGPLMQSTLGPTTRLTVEIGELQLDALSYEAYARLPVDHGVSATVEERTRFGAPFTLRLDEDLALILLDRELGGPGTLIPRNRPLSALELSVLRHPLETLANLVEELVRLQVPGAAMELVRMDGADRAQAGTRATEALLWIRQEVTLAGAKGDVHIILPFAAIEPVLALLAGEKGAEQEDDQRSPVLRPFVGLRHANTEARIGPAILTAGQVAALRPGDVVAMNVRVGQGFWMTVEGRPAFLVHDIGRVGIRTAVRVAQQLPSSFLNRIADAGVEEIQ